ncbi:hypothetical protein Tco_0813255 [Tanacetum coccineum]
MIQHESITLTLAQFGQILKIPHNGQAIFTNEWDLASLEYSQETEGPYYTELPTPDDIRRLLELERVVVDQNAFGLGGHRDRLPNSLAHMLYCVVTEEQYNLAYFFVKRIQCARDTLTTNLLYDMFLTRLYRHVMETYPHIDNGIYNIVERVMRPLALKQTRRPRPLALKQTQRPLSDRGKARHSVSSSSSHSSRRIINIDDDVMSETSRACNTSVYLLPPILTLLIHSTIKTMKCLPLPNKPMNFSLNGKPHFAATKRKKASEMRGAFHVL